MSDENNDVHNEDSSTSTDTQTDATAQTEDQSEDKSGKTVPYSRFKQVNDELKKLKGDDQDVTKPQSKDAPDLSKDVETLKERQAKADFRDEHNLTREATDWLFKVTGGNPTETDLEDPGIKAGLKELARANSVEENTPSSRRGAPTYNGKTWTEIANDPNVSEADKQKAYANLTNTKAGRR